MSRADKAPDQPYGECTGNNVADEIVRETLVTHAGRVVHPRVSALFGGPLSSTISFRSEGCTLQESASLNVDCYEWLHEVS